MTPSRSKSSRQRRLLIASLLGCQILALAVTVQATGAPQAAAKAVSPASVPKGFNLYGSSAVDGGECIAGNVTKEGTRGRAFVYFKDAKTQQPRWVTAIPVPPDYYQNRATHCFAMGGSLYVLIQSDTSQATSVSQTLLNVVELSPADGKVVSDQYADVPGIDAAYSSWVDKGETGFHEDNGKVKVSGQYFLMTEPGKHVAFTTSLPAHPAK